MSVLSTLQHIFPAPRYITLPNVGIDISDTSLKYIQFERERARDIELTLKMWGEVNIPAGVVDRGTVFDVQKLTAALKEMKEYCNTEYVRVSLPEERAYIFETTVKRDMPFREIRGLLEFKLEENVPMSPRDAFFDYQIVEDDKEEGVLRIVVTVYGKETIINYLDACQGAGLVPLSFEVEAEAIARAAVRKEYRDTYLVVDFGKTRTGVGIVHKGALMYTSTIDVGGQHLSSALRSQLGDIAESELTVIKNTQGLIHSGLTNAIRPALEEVVLQIQKELATRINYWHTRDVDRGERQIKKVILCGGSANLAGLPEFLQKNLSIQTERANVWRNAFSIESQLPPISKNVSYGYATAVGLALTDFVNAKL